MSQPVISIIVPIYNAEKFLVKCLKSILNQDFTDFELLLVDDGSSDNSRAICAEFALCDSRIIIVDGNHKGAASARNKGLDIAIGRYVVFVDSDDWVESNYLSDFFRQPFDDTKVTMVTQPIYFHYQDGRVANFIHYAEDILIVDNFAEQIVNNRILHNGCPVAKLLNLTIIKENNLRFDSKLTIHEDHVFIFDYLMLVEQIVISNVSTYRYMRYDGSCTLSTGEHSVSTYMHASSMLMGRIGKLTERYQMESHKEYIDLLYSDMGLHQIVCAIRRAKPWEYFTVIKVFNEKEIFFKNYSTLDRKGRKMTDRLLSMPLWVRPYFLIFPTIKRIYKKVLGKPLRK